MGCPIIDRKSLGHPIVDIKYMGCPILNGKWEGCPILDGEFLGHPVQFISEIIALSIQYPYFATRHAFTTLRHKCCILKGTQTQRQK
jgi:hypothetical protein